jgi:hypothetical protein
VLCLSFPCPFWFLNVINAKVQGQSHTESRVYLDRPDEAFYSPDPAAKTDCAGRILTSCRKRPKMWASYMPDTALIGQIWGNLAPEGEPLWQICGFRHKGCLPGRLRLMLPRPFRHRCETQTKRREVTRSKELKATGFGKRTATGDALIITFF